MISLIASGIFGSFLIIAGLVLAAFSCYGAYNEHFDLPLYEKQGWCWLAVGVSLFLAGVLIYFGWMFVSSTHELISFSVELRRKGFRVCSGGICEEALWADVQLIKQLTLFQRKNLTSQMVGTFYKVVLKNGKEHEFGRMSVNGIGEFVKILHEVALQNSIPWEKVEEHV